MLTPDLLHEYQQKAVNHQCMRPHSMLWLDMGLGKTVITLTSLSHLLKVGFLRGVIIVAPIRVIRLVWRQEAEKWAHTKDLTFSMVMGTRDQRTRALLRPADIYLINYENLGWLAETVQTYFVKKDRPLPFNGIVWDEISKMKNSSTQRVKSFRKIEKGFDWTTGLTGTPASNGYKDLHGQFLVVDRGERLGTSKTAFGTRFYRKVGPFKEVPFEDTESTIKQLIGDITLEMSAEDYNPLPDLIVNDVEVDLPDKLRAMYEQMEKDFFLQLDSGSEVEMFNQAALTNKCLQFSNGAVYPVAGMPLWEPVHELKLDALEDIIEEANGSPVLCAYTYRSDAERIMKRFHELDPINLTECKSEHSLTTAMHRWKTGDCRLMIGHPACVGEDTLVLTERNGWINIVDVEQTDRVFDGVEFVSHDGCSYSGYKDVIDMFGITMTPDHRLMIDGQWVEARNVRDTREGRNKAAFKWKSAFHGESEMSNLRGRIYNNSTKCREEQQASKTALFFMHKSNVSQADRNTHLEDMAWHDVASTRQGGQKLRRTWNKCLSRMVGFQRVLLGHVANIFRRSHHRTSECESTLLQRELCMGYQHGSTVKQTDKSIFGLSRGRNTSCRISQANRDQQNDAPNEIESRNVGRRSCGRCKELALWEEPNVECRKASRKAHVYDIVNCGPRHRFLIKNADGEMFISHNSMAHGIDGLQKNGHIVVWFGLNWSLDLYDQMNARVRRQGQGMPVICHRILTRNTLDQAQALALEEKATTQSGLRNAVKNYRLQKGK